MELYYHPLSRYSQKVLISLYEKQANFYPRVIDLQDPFERKKYFEINKLGKIPLLKCLNGRLIPESSIIIEFIDQHFTSGSRLLPADPERSLEVRLFDRIIDHDLNNNLYVLERLSLANDQQQNQLEIKKIKNRITAVLQQIEQQLEKNHWLCGDSFTLADCALLPCLDYALQNIESFEMTQLNRYHQQAQLRGAWMLVSDELAAAQTEAQTGLRLIP